MNKPLFAFIGLVYILVYAYFNFSYLWAGNDTLNGAMLGIMGASIGAAIGGIFSGWYSYQAGIKGARENYELNKKLANENESKQEKENMKRLISQISFLYEYLRNGSRESKFLCGIVYDSGWPEQLARSTSLSDEEKKIITDFFHRIILFEKEAYLRVQKENRRSDLPVMVAVAAYASFAEIEAKFADILPSIETITSKYQ